MTILRWVLAIVYGIPYTLFVLLLTAWGLGALWRRLRRAASRPSRTDQVAAAARKIETAGHFSAWEREVASSRRHGGGQ